MTELNKNVLRIPAETVFNSLLILCCSIAIGIIAGTATASLVSPKWIANGWPSFNHYPKNIELRSLMITLFLVPVFSIALEIIRQRWMKVSFAAILLSIAVVVVYDRLVLYDLSLWISHLLIILGLISVFYFSLNGLAAKNGDSSFSSFYYISGAGIIWAAYLVLFIMRYDAMSGEIDLHHNGEVFTSAVDLIRGGKPFVTFFWPHGLVDTGLIALVFTISSRIDIPTMYIGYFVMWSLAVPAFFICSYGLRLGYFAFVIGFISLCFNPTIIFFLPYFLFVFLSFLVFAKGRQNYHFFIAGILMFLAHVFRIDTSSYGLASVLIVVAYLIVSAVFQDRDILRFQMRRLIFFLFGIIVSAIAMYAIIGWPDYNWYKVTFSILPKYHADSTGFPFPLPLYGTYNYQLMSYEEIVLAVSYLILVSGMLGTACIYLYRNFGKASSMDILPLLLIVLAVLNIRTAFGRSDIQHVIWSSSIAYLIIGLLFAKTVIHVPFLKRWLKFILLVSFFIFFDFSSGLFDNNPIENVKKIVYESNTNFFEEYRNMPRQCSSGLFSYNQLLKNPFLDQEVCATQKMLYAFKVGKRSLLIAHSAALLYPMLGYDLPTKYYELGWAITDEMQRDLVHELEKANISAILIVAPGYHSMPAYDIPDPARMPIYWEWATQRFDFSRGVVTPLGILLLRRQ